MRKIFVVAALLFIAGNTSSFAAERAFELKARKFSYTPNIITVNKGDSVKIRLMSEDVHHGFFLDGYEVEMQAHPGQDGAVSFVADKPGRFNFRCSVTCGEFHPYMVGYFVVEPNSRLTFFIFLMIILAVLSFSLINLRTKKETSNGER